MKYLPYSWVQRIAFGVVAFITIGCNSTENTGTELDSYLSIAGETMGTTYTITYQDTAHRNFKAEIDELLVALNQDVSTYIPTSTISLFNQSASGLKIDPKANRYFLDNWLIAKKVNDASAGAFDPTVMPLVNYWGFGYKGRKKVAKVNTDTIDMLRQLVGLSKIELDTSSGSYHFQKPLPEVQLDFSGCAKGYGVDLVAAFLEDQGIENYLVEIGREVRGKGSNKRGEPWQIGISLPKEGAASRAIHSVVPLENIALATSGNYQNYYEVEGEKFSHTINPKTGYSEQLAILSASVFAPTCAEADAIATAFMVMGHEAALGLANEQPGIETYLIIGGASGEMSVLYSKGLKYLFEENK